MFTRETEEVRNIKVLSSHKDSDYEIIEINGRIAVRRKSNYTPPRCEYCKSRNINEYSCNQCGAPIK